MPGNKLVDSENIDKYYKAYIIFKTWTYTQIKHKCIILMLRLQAKSKLKHLPQYLWLFYILITLWDFTPTPLKQLWLLLSFVDHCMTQDFPSYRHQQVSQDVNYTVYSPVKFCSLKTALWKQLGPCWGSLRQNWFLTLFLVRFHKMVKLTRLRITV